MATIDTPHDWTIEFLGSRKVAVCLEPIERGPSTRPRRRPPDTDELDFPDCEIAVRRSYAKAAASALTLTVRRLERDGLVTRTVHPTVPPQVEYELTTMGHSLTHLVKALADWSARIRDAIARARQEWDVVHPDSGIR
ncbi:winged helix-turn-helix transcriptional regulator [Streptomyces sp. NPDC057592]|uniref:winged helix-turn-helix transcriptional regulator n=1 Tax=unclassified Streptomyces TaxID=2593676 RepID=UPI003689B1C2